jgi:hypothetical protein
VKSDEIDSLQKDIEKEEKIAELDEIRQKNLVKRNYIQKLEHMQDASAQTHSDLEKIKMADFLQNLRTKFNSENDHELLEKLSNL